MPNNLTPQAVFRPSLADTPVYRSSYVPSRPDVIKLNHNEAAWDVPDDLKDEVLARLRAVPWHRYPDPFQAELKDALVAATGHPRDGIVVTNGGNAALMQLLCVLDAAARVISCPPSYYVYGRVCRWLGLDHHTVLARPDGFEPDVEGVLAAARPPCALFVASPNNPTGSLPAPAALDRILAEFPGLVVVDEAYFDFSGVTVADRIADHDNLLVVRTFSKAYGAAGVRAGWLLGDPAWIAEIDKATTPYTVDAFSQVTATVLLGHADRLRERVEATLTERERLRAAVDGLPGYETEPSAGNFFLVHLAFRLGPPADLLAWLKARDIVLRDTSRHPLLEDTFRITVGRPDESDRIVAALAEYAER